MFVFIIQLIHDVFLILKFKQNLLFLFAFFIMFCVFARRLVDRMRIKTVAELLHLGFDRLAVAPKLVDQIFYLLGSGIFVSFDFVHAAIKLM